MKSDKFAASYKALFLCKKRKVFVRFPKSMDFEWREMRGGLFVIAS